MHPLHPLATPMPEAMLALLRAHNNGKRITFFAEEYASYNEKNSPYRLMTHIVTHGGVSETDDCCRC